MASAKPTAPALRFKGFVEEWEGRPLGDIAEKVTRTDPNSTAPVMMITADNGFIKQSDRYAFNNSGQSLTKYIVLKRKELAYNHGASKLRPYGSCFALPYKEARVPFVYHCFSVDNDNPDFISIQLNGTAVEAELRKIVSSGARMDGLLNISYEAYSKVPISLPNPDEQGVVANYFNNLDDLIALQRRKLVKLQNVKKAMLQKMFPARGSTTPQIRFAGFTEPWEECALADALSLLKDGTHGTHTNVGDGYYLLSAKNIKNGSVVIDSATDRMISEDEFKKIHWNFQLKKGDVLLTIVGSIGESAIIDNSEKITFQRSVAYLRPNNRTTSEFLLSTIASSQFQDELQNRQVVSAQPGIYLGVLGAITVQFPKIAEQIKIGAYFKHLDTRISLQQRKLEKLQNVKKACLAAMFV